MADGFVQVQPDSTGKLLDMEELARPTDGLVVERERVVVQRPGDASSSMRPEVSNPPLLGAVRLAVAQLAEIRKTLRQRVSSSGESRRFSFKGAAQHLLRMTGLESLSVAQTEMPNVEQTRAGQRFFWGTVNTGGGGANFAPVASPPTNPSVALYNGAPVGGPTVFLDTVGFWLSSGTPATGALLMATVAPTPFKQGTFAQNGAYVSNKGIWSCSGSTRKSYAFWSNTSVAFVNVSVDTLAWIPLACCMTVASAAAGQGAVVSMGGSLALPPGYAVGFCVLSSAGTSPLYNIGGTFTEQQADME